MNVSELARRLRVTPEELLQKLPRLGFDIGRRAIKIPNHQADRIIQAWAKQAKKDELAKKYNQEADASKGTGPQTPTEIHVPAVITVREFAALLNRPIAKVLAQLMKNGILASMNERIDFDTASIIADDFNTKVILTQDTQTNEDQQAASDKLDLAKKNAGEQAVPRPPVVVVMGHVDHGKTKLLDSIRQANVMGGESGGITQHIGAYQVTRNNRAITFIDTPGHEAFTAMRARGARVADIAILVVAADDSIQPQTKEALKIIQSSNLPFIVAINKIDKPEANVERVKQDLAQLNLLPEDWGGKTITVPISALTGKGIDNLLDHIILVADMEKENIKADPSAEGIGMVIEAHVDKGEGPVATVVMQNGTLTKNQFLIVNGTNYGKAKLLKDHTAKEIITATPSVPVRISGFRIAPEVGDIVEASSEARGQDKKLKHAKKSSAPETVISSSNTNDEQTITVPIVLKTDVLGSSEAIIESLAKIELPGAKAKVVSRSLGTINEADVVKAASMNAELIGFHVTVSPAAEQVAREKGVEIKKFEVIYHLIEAMQEKLKSLIKPKEIVTDIGRLQVLALFQKTKNGGIVVGGRVLNDKITKGAKIRVLRNNEIVAEGTIANMQHNKQPVDQLRESQEGGMEINGTHDILVGDILQAFTITFEQRY